jgi:predicted permease
MVDDPPHSGRGAFTRALLSIARVWLPVSLAVVGLVLAVIGHGKTTIAAIGVCLILVALTVWLINLMFRLSVESNRDREREEEARDYFERYGHWPGDER